MAEYILRETTYPLATKQEVVGELVRCKDCVHYEIDRLKKDGTEDKRYKPTVCMLHLRSRRPDWYCADGERRTDG